MFYKYKIYSSSELSDQKQKISCNSHMHGRYAKKLEQPWQCYYYTRIIFFEIRLYVHAHAGGGGAALMRKLPTNSVVCTIYCMSCNTRTFWILPQFITSSFVPPPLWINIMSHFDEPKMDKKYLKIVSKFSDYFTANSIFSYTMQQCVLTRMKSCCCKTIAQQKQQYLSILHIGGHDNDKER